MKARAKAKWMVSGSAASNQQVKRGEMIIDRCFNAAVRLNKSTGQIRSKDDGKTKVLATSRQMDRAAEIVTEAVMKWTNKQTQKEWQTEQIDSPCWLAGWMKTDRPIEPERRIDSDAVTPGGQQSTETHFQRREHPFTLLYIWYQRTSAAAAMSTANTFYNRLHHKRQRWFVSATVRLHKHLEEKTAEVSFDELTKDPILDRENLLDEDGTIVESAA